MINNIIHGDAIETLNLIEDKSVDLVLTDPPYNISRKNNFKTMGRAGIDFGEWDKGFDLFSYIDVVKNKLNKDGSLIVFNDWKNIGDIARYAESIGFVIKDLIRFEKTNPMPRNRDRRYITDFEVAVWLTMPRAKWTFNRQSEGYERPKFVGNVESGLHPNQKNLGLMEWLIKIHSNEGDLVVDPFCGSGIIPLACINTQRNFIAVDKHEPYVIIANKLINASKEEVK